MNAKQTYKYEDGIVVEARSDEDADKAHEDIMQRLKQIEAIGDNQDE